MVHVLKVLMYVMYLMYSLFFILHFTLYAFQYLLNGADHSAFVFLAEEQLCLYLIYSSFVVVFLFYSLVCMYIFVCFLLYLPEVPHESRTDTKSGDGHSPFAPFVGIL
uniref:Uncharacterized protein n=1 Tax=Rhipicephalus pulchellus TaxID=72859 RepID=L7M0B3_RHIPC